MTVQSPTRCVPPDPCFSGDGKWEEGRVVVDFLDGSTDVYGVAKVFLPDLRDPGFSVSLFFCGRLVHLRNLLAVDVHTPH